MKEPVIYNEGLISKKQKVVSTFPVRKLNTDVSRGKTFVGANHSDEGVTAH